MERSSTASEKSPPSPACESGPRTARSALSSREDSIICQPDRAEWTNLTPELDWPLAGTLPTRGQGVLGGSRGRRARRGRISSSLLDLGRTRGGRRAARGTDLVLRLDLRLLSAARDGQRHRQETGSRQGGDELLHDLPFVLWVFSSPCPHPRCIPVAVTKGSLQDSCQPLCRQRKNSLSQEDKSKDEPRFPYLLTPIHERGLTMLNHGQGRSRTASGQDARIARWRRILRIQEHFLRTARSCGPLVRTRQPAARLLLRWCASW